jgi:hypothetical protein
MFLNVMDSRHHGNLQAGITDLMLVAKHMARMDNRRQPVLGGIIQALPGDPAPGHVCIDMAEGLTTFGGRKNKKVRRAFA